MGGRVGERAGTDFSAAETKTDDIFAVGRPVPMFNPT